MNYLNDEIYGFGNDTNLENEQAKDFNYNSISGLGESNYENEDLFLEQTESSKNIEKISDVFNIENSNLGSVGYVGQIQQNDLLLSDSVSNLEISDLEKTLEFKSFDFQNNNMFEETEPVVENSFEIEQPVEQQEDTSYTSNIFEETEPVVENSFEIEQPIEQPVEQQEDPSYTSNIFEEPEPVVENNFEIDPQEEEDKNEIIVSETTKEELEELTKFEDDKIEETYINSLFDKVSVNVKDASDIFRKNTDIKQKIDTRFEELKKLQSNLESSRKKQIDEIDQYKDEVLTKLTEKKDEIEKRLNILKEAQATLEKEKKEFEQYKKKEQENIDKVQKQVQAAYDDRREELSHIEDKLRKQKDALDEERNQLSLDKIQYESDKNELANNLLKFNEIVDSFTMGVNDIKE